MLSDSPIIYLISTGDIRPRDFAAGSQRFLSVVRVAVSCRVSLIQMREKALPAGMVFDLARRAADITGGSKTKLLINDRADIALAAGADGVHLTAASMPAAVIKRNFPGLLIAASTHSLDEVRSARENGVDFAVFGPVFSSPGKGDPVGLGKLAEAAEMATPIPLLALGGVDGSNWRQSMDSGAKGFAAIRFLNNEENLKHLCSEIG